MLYQPLLIQLLFTIIEIHNFTFYHKRKIDRLNKFVQIEKKKHENGGKKGKIHAGKSEPGE